MEVVVIIIVRPGTHLLCCGVGTRCLRRLFPENACTKGSFMTSRRATDHHESQLTLVHIQSCKFHANTSSHLHAFTFHILTSPHIQTCTSSNFVLFFCLSVFLSFPSLSCPFLTFLSSFFLSFCRSVCLSVRPSVCLSFSFR